MIHYEMLHNGNEVLRVFDCVAAERVLACRGTLAG